MWTWIISFSHIAKVNTTIEIKEVLTKLSLFLSFPDRQNLIPISVPSREGPPGALQVSVRVAL